MRCRKGPVCVDKKMTCTVCSWYQSLQSQHARMSGRLVRSKSTDFSGRHPRHARPWQQTHTPPQPPQLGPRRPAALVKRAQSVNWLENVYGGVCLLDRSSLGTLFSFYAGELLASLNSLLLLPCLPLFSASKHLKMLLDSPVMSNISGAVTAGVRSVGGSGVAGGGNADEAGFGGGGGPAGLITSSR